MAFFNLLKGIGIVVSVLSAGFSYKAGRSKLTDAKYEISTYDVTGISPQSMTVAQLLKGLASSGTL